MLHVETSCNGKATAGLFVCSFKPDAFYLPGHFSVCGGSPLTQSSFVLDDLCNAAASPPLLAALLGPSSLDVPQPPPVQAPCLHVSQHEETSKSGTHARIKS